MTTRSNRLLSVLIAAFALISAGQGSAGTQDPAHIKPLNDKGDEKAARIEQASRLIKEARAALGGEEALRKVQTLSTSGRFKNFVKYVSVESPKKVVEKEKKLSGKVGIDFLMPDRFRRQWSGQTFRGFGYSYAEVVNGSRAWRNPPLRAISSNKDRRVIDVGDFERTVELQARGARQQLTQYLLGWFLQPLPSFPLEFSYVGQAMTFSGQANVILVQGPDNYRVYLLLDPQTNLPLAIAEPFMGSRRSIVVVESSGIFDRKFMSETVRRAAHERQSRMTPSQHYEMHLKFSDYRQTAGMLLPHRITTSINLEIIEELTFDQYQINHFINPKKFEGQPEPKY